MTGTLHLAWYDPINTVANIGSPTHDGHGVRDNDATLSAAGGGLPGFTLEFTSAGPGEDSDLIRKSYLAINDARYRDNFIVVAHPHTGIAETYEFPTNDNSEIVLMNEHTTGLWEELPDDPDIVDPPPGTIDHRTSTLTIMPSVDIDCDVSAQSDRRRAMPRRPVDGIRERLGGRRVIGLGRDIGSGVVRGQEPRQGIRGAGRLKR